MNQPPNLQNLFSGSGVHWVPGVGWLGTGQSAGPLAGPQGGALGDDASVMMISGLGAPMGDVPVAAPPPADGVTAAPPPTPGLPLTVVLGQPVTIAGVTLPLWVWLLVAAGGVGVAGYFMLGFHKKK